MISMDKKYKTRDGHEVRVLAVDAKGPFPVIVMVSGGGTDEDVIRVGSNGQRFSSGPSEDDLIEVKPERTVWVNIYAHCNHYGYNSRDRADAMSSVSRIACVPVTFREGDGL